ncbi:MAG TPA: hypothetical protein VH370_03590 [Humisphaera sp.]|jgi:hypothetical protein|nr:hypothetical protein [Humisphaera sp.]
MPSISSGSEKGIGSLSDGAPFEHILHGDILRFVQWTLIQMPTFNRRWRSEKLPDDDLQALESAIMRAPSAGAVMRGTGGLRKARFAPPSRGTGKSGSMRIGYAQFPQYRLILLVTLFLKKDEENLDAATCAGIKALLHRVSHALQTGAKP